MRRPLRNLSSSLRSIVSVRRRSAIFAVSALTLLSLMVLEGCASYLVARWESPPEGQNQIKVGTPRSIVEQVLGEPVAKDGAVHTYEYSTKDRPNPAIVVPLDVLTMGMMSFHWGDMEKGYQSQRARRQLAYGPDDRVISLSPTSANVTFEQWLRSEERAANLELLCEAANNGQPGALAVQAASYRYGLWGAEVNPTKAYLFIRLAAFFGNPSALRTSYTWRAGMSPEDLAEAERQTAHWQPNPAECEAIAAEQTAKEALDLKTMAEQGNADAQYQLGVLSSSPRESWKWFCLAANQRHPQAQLEIGNFYETGRDPVSVDLGLAYVWYKLAELNGFEENVGSRYRKTTTGYKCCFPSKSHRQILAEQLDLAQLSEADRLVAEWEPNPAECEIEAQAKN